MKRDQDIDFTNRKEDTFSMRHAEVMATIFPRALALTVGLSLLISQAGAAPQSVPIVLQGRVAAVVIMPDKPTAVVRYGAEELVHHVQKATGAKPKIVTESHIDAGPLFRIYLGDCRATRSAGINVEKMAPETFVLRTGDKVLFIAGRDTDGDPLDRDTSAGTLFGVYEWLERDLGVRWVWPGELGTFVPKSDSAIAQRVDEAIAPRLSQRNIRAGLDFTSSHPALGFTSKTAAEYARAQTVFLRRHRMGRSRRMSYGHAFTDWWETYGQDHPEWFQLVNGKRGPQKPGGRYSMCVSNVDLQREIVARWKARGGAEMGSGPSFINAVENDILGLCECEKCKAWDGPEPTDAMRFYSPNFKVYGSQFVSDRYARFSLAVQQLAAQENPQATVIGYVYFNYFQAPTSGVRLNSNILLGYCPSAGWYPRGDDEHTWYKQQWKGWRDTGARLFSRTNYFLDGYCMPFVFAHQFADDFQHAFREGMVATDFDSLTGQWSTQGPNLYLLMRLHTRPEAKPDDLLAEYYSAFGPAASDVKHYFDYWERYTMDNRPLIAQAFEDRVAVRWRTWAKVTHQVYPQDCFAPAAAILAKAIAAAARDQEAAARIEFLKQGLDHAQLCARVSSLLTLADPQSTPERGKMALDELLAFRRAKEKQGIANFNHSAWVEDLSWKLSHETKQEPELYP